MEIVNLVFKKCMPLAKNDESKAFYWKVIGDNYRYIAESCEPSTLNEAKKGTIDSYIKAQKFCDNLNPCNPIRLGLALNFSVYY